MAKKKPNLSKFMEPNYQAIIEAVVAELGETPEEIAASLKRLRIKGYKESPSSCPLAMYLEDRGIEGAEVMGREVESFGGEFKLPKAYGKFVTKFDSGKFPELDYDPQSEGDF